MEDAGLDYDFVQDNQSKSSKGVLRGLHYQIAHPQAKLVRVVEGEVYDVAVDLRVGSPTYGKWFGVILSAENMRQFLIPRGFAHGFQVLSESAVFCYKCDDFYHPGDEGGIRWNDPDLNIPWPGGDEPLLSEKDRVQPFFRDLVRRWRHTLSRAERGSSDRTSSTTSCARILPTRSSASTR